MFQIDLTRAPAHLQPGLPARLTLIAARADGSPLDGVFALTARIDRRNGREWRDCALSPRHQTHFRRPHFFESLNCTCSDVASNIRQTLRSGVSTESRLSATTSGGAGSFLVDVPSDDARCCLASDHDKYR